MGNRAENAVMLKHSGNNCAQAVLLAYADILPFDEAELKKLGAAFGIGMGTFDATCGALCAAQMILGLLRSDGRPLARDAKELFEGFRAKCGSTHCGELKATPHKACAEDAPTDFFVRLYRNSAGILSYVKGFLCKMTENMSADSVQSRQAGFVRCCLKGIKTGTMLCSCDDCVRFAADLAGDMI
ncbi:MAG: C_GCAxxG_C_C family protein [Ruminococcus sp.]|nr:C_GCAxxG_C_C family protein [Ruminococcus sp.]